MKKSEVVRMFESEVRPSLDHTDKPALREQWGYLTDQLCKDGKITQKQYETWVYPSYMK